jgi:hypothetical protein
MTSSPLSSSSSMIEQILKLIVFAVIATMRCRISSR